MEFIYQLRKKETTAGIEIKTFYVDKNGESRLKINTIDYSIFCLKSDFEKLNIQSENLIISENSYTEKKGGVIIKLEICNSDLYEFILAELKKMGSTLFELDLPKESRFLVEKEISLGRLEKIPKLKLLAIDIETIGSLDNLEITMISLYSSQDAVYNKVLLNSLGIDNLTIENLKKTKFKEFNLKLFSSEKELLEGFKSEILIIKPQIILGWNVIDFDLRVISERMKLFGISFKLSNFEGNSLFRLSKNFFKASTLNIPGILVWDGIDILKNNFISFEDFKLDTVAKAVLGDNKIEIDITPIYEDKGKAIERMYKSETKKLIEYNFKDSKLVVEILEKFKLIDLMITRSIITNTPISKVNSPIASLDIMYLTKLHKRGIIANSNFNFQNSVPIMGAYVIEPKSGFYKDIFVFDFKSLYPSIIMTFNIDPFSYIEKIGDGLPKRPSSDTIKAPNGAEFTKPRAILPDLILKLYNQRNLAKKHKDSIRSNAIKTTMNSFYGAMASPKSRFYNKNVGSAITAFARHIIKKAKTFLENKGLVVIYGDTDSVFVKIPNLKNKSFEEKKSIGINIETSINEFFSDWVANEFGVKSFLIIELEKIYSNFFIASKKRYVGLDLFTNKTKFVGMEAIRGDWTPLAKTFQKEIISLIFISNSEKVLKNKIKEFIILYIQRLKNKEFDDELIYTKKITKPLVEYTKTTPPHVRAARELGDFKGRIVKYIMTKKGPKHISLLEKGKTDFDYSHYIEKQLKGVSDDILENLALDFDEITNFKKQSNLNRFF